MGKKDKQGEINIIKALVLLVVLFVFANPNGFKNLTGFVQSILPYGAFILILVTFGYLFSKKISSDQKQNSLTKTNGYPFSADPPEWSLNLIQSLEWKCFETLCTYYFEAKGFYAKETCIGADGGVDIELFKEKDSIKPFGIVQCKAWSNKIGVKAIRELYGVMVSEKVELGYFITSGDFSKDARLFSNGKNIKLLTGQDLLESIESLPERIKKAILQKTTEYDYITPTCPSCGIKMQLRVAKRGPNTGKKFWGCLNYPKCHRTFHFKQTKEDFSISHVVQTENHEEVVMSPSPTTEIDKSPYEESEKNQHDVDQPKDMGKISIKQPVKATKIINLKTGKDELEEDLTKWMHPDMRKKLNGLESNAEDVK